MESPSVPSARAAVIIRRPSGNVAATSKETALAARKLPKAFVIPPVKRIVDDAVAVIQRDLKIRISQPRLDDAGQPMPLSEGEAKTINHLMSALNTARGIDQSIQESELAELSDEELQQALLDLAKQREETP